MLKDNVAVLEVGSYSVTALIGERGVNGTFLIRTVCESKYEGFQEGAFLDPDGFRSAVINAVRYISDNARADVRTLYVGVPGAFLKSENRKSRIVFRRKRKITKKDISDLYDSAEDLVISGNYGVINRTAVYFTLDDNRKVYEPAGNYSTTLGGYISFVLCDKYFINIIGGIASELGISEVHYVGEGLAESLFLLEREKREVSVIVADVGYITSSVSMCLGDGVVYSSSSDFGGGYITAELSRKYDLDFQDAEILKRKINLGSQGNGISYILELRDGIRKFDVEEVNEEVKIVIDGFCGFLDKFLNDCPFGQTDGIKIYLTGGGISYIRGICEHIAGRLATSVEIIYPDVPNHNKADESAALSILDFSLRDYESRKKKFFIF